MSKVHCNKIYQVPVVDKSQLTSLSDEVFFLQYQLNVIYLVWISYQNPVIIRHPKLIETTKKWNLEYLAHEFGSTQVTVMMSPTKQFKNP